MRHLGRSLAAPFAGALLAGCSLTVPITRPTPSGPSFSDATARPATLAVLDERAGDETQFHVLTGGLAHAKVSLEGIDSPIAFLAESLGKEFAARGYPVHVTTDRSAASDLQLHVKRYRIVSRRSSGFAPWESMHQFAGTLTARSLSRDIYAYFYNGKFPVWSMKEVFEPCYDTPASILVKEIASKVNHAMLGFRSGDTVVADLAKKAAPKDDQDNGPSWEILELGGTNNPAAMEILKRYAAHKDEFVRACSFSAIGMLGPERELAFLKERYAALRSMDKYMALAAIGDAGDADSLAFVKSQMGDPLYHDEPGMQYVVDLYSGR